MLIKNKQPMRSLIAFLVTWSFVILTVTGIVLYIVPQGRVAYWIHWSLLGLEKTEWGNLHMMFGGIFILTGILHLYFNWKPFKKYLLERAKGRIQLKQELVVSLLLSLAVVVMSVYSVPPVSWVFDLSERVKEAWITSPALAPPFGHAEEVSLKGITRRMDLDYQQAVESLNQAGLDFKGDDSLSEIAQRNDMTPMQVYGLFSHLKLSAPPVDYAKLSLDELEARFAGTGLGRKSVSEVSEQVGLDEIEVMRRLMAKGINADREVTLRELAQRHGMNPIDILQLMVSDAANGNLIEDAEK